MLRNSTAGMLLTRKLGSALEGAEERRSGEVGKANISYFSFTLWKVFWMDSFGFE
jgi:hypothetical protein